MAEEWVKGETLKFKNVTVNVYRPVLTAPERVRREQQVKNAMVTLMRDYYSRKEEKEEH